MSTGISIRYHDCHWMGEWDLDGHLSNDAWLLVSRYKFLADYRFNERFFCVFCVCRLILTLAPCVTNLAMENVSTVSS